MASRVYPRKFDYEEAAAMRARGLSYGEIARHFGVSDTAVMYAIDREFQQRRKEQAAAARRHYRALGKPYTKERKVRCEGCGGEKSRRARRCRDCTEREARELTNEPRAA